MRFSVPTLYTILLTLLSPITVNAHLMVAQHGTLNFVDDGAFMVMSLPVSAFENLDDDENGSVSMIEFNRYRGAIVDSIVDNVTLSDDEGLLQLDGVMLSPVLEHDSANGSLSQLTVMGRFTLTGGSDTFRFQVQLFGTKASEQMLEITATRQSDGQEQVLELTPAASSELLFAGR